MKERSLDVFQPEMIVHPILGEFLTLSFSSPSPKYLSSFPLTLTISTFPFLHIYGENPGHPSPSIHVKKALYCAIFFFIPS